MVEEEVEEAGGRRRLGDHGFLAFLCSLHACLPYSSLPAFLLKAAGRRAGTCTDVGFETSTTRRRLSTTCAPASLQAFLLKRKTKHLGRRRTLQGEKWKRKRH